MSNFVRQNIQDFDTENPGMNVVPIPQEGVINASPLVGGAVMFGRGRTQCGILIEPAPEYAIDPNDPESLPEFRNKVWYVVLCCMLDAVSSEEMAGQLWKRQTASRRRSRGCTRR